MFQLESDGKTQHFVPIQEVSPQMVKIALLNTRKILLFDFHSEVYVWIGKQSPGALRKKALELGKEHFAKPCRCVRACVHACVQEPQTVTLAKKQDHEPNQRFPCGVEVLLDLISPTYFRQFFFHFL